MNRLERLKEQLQSAVRGREISNQDIANLLGCGRPTISVAIRTGEFNTRLSRTLDFVDIAIAAHGIGDMFVFIDEDKYSDEAQVKKGMSMLAKFERNTNYVIAEKQIDFVDDADEPTQAVECSLEFLSDELKAQAEDTLTPKQKAQASALYQVSHTAAVGMIENIIKNTSKIDDKKEENPNYGHKNPLTLADLKADIDAGHINETFENLEPQIISMFGKSESYKFAQVRAAIVALEEPSMVSLIAKPYQSEMFVLGLIKKNEKLVETFTELELEMLARRVMNTSNEMGMHLQDSFDSISPKLREAILIFIDELGEKASKRLLTARRMKWTMLDSEHLQPWVPEEFKK